MSEHDRRRESRVGISHLARGLVCCALVAALLVSTTSALWAESKPRIYRSLREARRAGATLRHLRLSARELALVRSGDAAMLRRVTVLELTIGKERALPAALFHCRALEVLRVSTLLEAWRAEERGLKSLTPRIASLKRLRVLDLSFNQLTTLPAALAKLSRLQMLNLSGNQLERLPSVVSRLTGLRTLDLSLNPLRQLPPTLAKLQRLERLDLGAGGGEGPYGELIRDFPAVLVKLPRLRELVIDRQPFERWLPGLVSLTSLRLLRLGEWFRARSSNPRALETLRRMRPKLKIDVTAYD